MNSVEIDGPDTSANHVNHNLIQEDTIILDHDEGDVDLLNDEGANDGENDEVTPVHHPSMEIINVTKKVSLTKEVSMAWLCFDRKAVILKNGIEYLKCNQKTCNKEFRLQATSATNLARHVQSSHRFLLAKGFDSKQSSIAKFASTSIEPSFFRITFGIIW